MTNSDLLSGFKLLKPMLLVPVLDPMALGPLRPSAAELVRGRWLADRPEIPGLVCVLSVGVPLVPRTADLEGRVDPALIPGAGAVLSRLVTEAGLFEVSRARLSEIRLLARTLEVLDG
eukprot:XP_001708487.1 Hypothetical protein GL50803_12140 [Giardia lamblia ATCC 50803]